MLIIENIIKQETKELLLSILLLNMVKFLCLIIEIEKIHKEIGIITSSVGMLIQIVVEILIGLKKIIQVNNNNNKNELNINNYNENKIFLFFFIIISISIKKIIKIKMR